MVMRVIQCLCVLIKARLNLFITHCSGEWWSLLLASYLVEERVRVLALAVESAIEEDLSTSDTRVRDCT